MSTKTMLANDEKVDITRTTVKQVEFVVPQLTVKDLLSAIPPHCMQRSAWRSGAYIVWDFLLIYAMYHIATAADAWLDLQPGLAPHVHPYLHAAARVALWGAYSFGAGLVGTGLWIIGHDVGLAIHSMLGVPYHAWRITHAKHHAQTSHCDEDQAYVPKTRSYMNLPPLDSTQEDEYGASVTEKVKAELIEALGDSPLGATLGSAGYLLPGFQYYLFKNASGQPRYPLGTNHFVPKAPLFAQHQFWDIIISDIGLLLWVGILVWWSVQRGAGEMLRVYFVPYLWVNHWIVLITFLQHTDPLLPHYRKESFTFARGALSTFDRSLLGGAGSFWAWIGASATHGISETHVLHHVSSRIPHYHAWEASDALKQRLREAGIEREGRPGGWSEVYRVFKECRFIEDTGSVVFYKNAKGLAAARPVWADSNISDSGIEVQ
ncbi:delta12-fatty acid desaturase [Auriculariales sp. MPI-PUGE-AT-0066]|nr:delta12-fatty acid desaturase [Auriculariales sp. MPI-PUGE-AT-0066]